VIEFLALSFCSALKWIGLVAGIVAVALVACVCITHDQVGREIDREGTDD
jgi:hypothetical protein